MGFPVPVSVQGNLVFADFPIPSPMATLHKVQPPVGPPIPIAPCIEAPVPVMWPPGFGLQQNKLTTTVYHKFQWIMLDGHDCGYMIPHVTIPPVNVLLPIQIAFSSRKTTNTYDETDRKCVVRYSTPFEGVAAGRVWGEITCPDAGS